MLKNLDPLLTPELLHVLAAMGHGDELVLCDANFPAESVARATHHGRPVRLPGASAPVVARAILSLLPLDEDVSEPVLRMEVSGDPEAMPPVQQEVQAVVDEGAGAPVRMGSIERFAFYDRARRAYAVVASGERRFWGCFVFVKGVVPPPHAER
jgi:L-fucose mutarotase